MRGWFSLRIWTAMTPYKRRPLPINDLYSLGNMPNGDDMNKLFSVDDLKEFRSSKIGHHSLFRSDVAGDLDMIIEELHV